MLKIYGNALGVSIWLGEPRILPSSAEEKHVPLDLIPFQVNLELLDVLIADVHFDEDNLRLIIAFADLLRRSKSRCR
jgi:hypothetical protein